MYGFLSWYIQGKLTALYLSKGNKSFNTKKSKLWNTDTTRTTWFFNLLNSFLFVCLLLTVWMLAGTCCHTSLLRVAELTIDYDRYFFDARALTELEAWTLAPFASSVEANSVKPPRTVMCRAVSATYQAHSLAHISMYLISNSALFLSRGTSWSWVKKKWWTPINLSMLWNCVALCFTSYWVRSWWR